MAYIDEVNADSPVAYWPLDESSGNLIDAVGTKDFTPYTGLTRNTSELTAPFGASGALAADGTDGVASDSANNSSFVNGTGFTWEFWCKPAVNATKMALLHRSDMSNFGADEQYGMNFRADNKAECFIQVSGGTYNTAGGNQFTWVAGNTYHMCMVWNGTTLYLIANGNEVSQIASGRPNSAFDSTADTHFGCEYNNVPARISKWNGTIDNIAFYSTALSRARIQAHYDAGVARTWPDQAPYGKELLRWGAR